jgi:Omp85 superfamily domain/WD40-like Beta Propeller Repeat
MRGAVRILGKALRAAPMASLLLTTTGTQAASFPPAYRFRSLSTSRVTVHFHQGLEPMARQAAALATRVLEAHEARYGHRIGRLNLVLADTEDDPNGFATPLPYPLVSVRMASPDGSDDFGNLEGWLPLVITHELAHAVHLDESRGIIHLGRRVFGRAPFLFPNALTPTWMIEGLATYEETEGTAFGRGRNPDSRMVLRMAALEDAFLHQDQAVLGLDAWPSGQSSYLFGEAFLREMTARHGPSTLPELARVHSGRVIPFTDDLTAQRVTGASFHRQWSEWQRSLSASFSAEAEARRLQGLTVSRALTHRGIRQSSPRWSPNGSGLAYTSRTLTRYPALRLMRPDGTGDRKLTDRSGGTGLSWTPDGKGLVYDELRVEELVTRRSDLRIVEVETGHRRWLTKGARARAPDVSPDGRTVVFVRRLGDRSELASIAMDGTGLRTLTQSDPGTEWSGPRWRPQGDLVVASRLLPGGWLDLVEVEPATGACRSLTEDRAKDVEPTWTPDGAHVLFRSDRDGISNLYALRRADLAVLRVSNVLGGAFTPAASPDGHTVAFASYSASGYDVHVMDADLATAPPAEPFVDPYPAPQPRPEHAESPSRPYRPLPTMLPRFWSPVLLNQDDEVRYGAATAGTDPLFRHSYGLTSYVGSTSGKLSALGFYQYDRLWPTFLITAEDRAELSGGRPYRTRTLNLRGSFPLVRTLRSVQSLSFTWRRERQTYDDLRPALEPADRGGLETAWSLSTAQQYAQSISPVDGGRLRVAWLRESPAFGSDVKLSKLTADARAYVRAFGDRDVLALRAGGGLTLGQPGFTRSFSVGGYPDSSLFDLVRANVALLRGYPDDAFSGRSFLQANAEYRFPLGNPQRGFRTLPVFLRHLRGSLFFDAAEAWSGELRLRAVKTAAGAGLGIDSILANRLPFTGEVVAAHGFDLGGETKVYFRIGLSF